MQFTPVKAEELSVGQALPWTLYDPSGKVIMEQGAQPASVEQIQALIAGGAGRHTDTPTTPTESPEKSQQAKHESGGYSLSQIKLKIGDPIQLQLQSGTANTRCFVNLIGYLEEQSVIVTMPVQNGRIMMLREGQSFVVRFFSEKNAYAFSAIAKKITSNPYPYLHLSYPVEVRGLVVRSSSRAHTHINCHASTAEGANYKCITRDISIGGALIAAREKLGEAGDKLTLNLPVKIGETEHALTLKCEIRSANSTQASANEPPVYLFGLSFVNMASQDTLVITALLYKNLISDKDAFE